MGGEASYSRNAVEGRTRDYETAGEDENHGESGARFHDSKPGFTTPVGGLAPALFYFWARSDENKGSFCPRRIVSLACITADDGSDCGIQFYEPDPRSQHRPLRPGGAPQVPRVPRKQDTATTARTLRVLQSQS